MRRVLLLLLAVVAVGGGYAVAASMGGSRPDDLPSPVRAVEKVRAEGREARARVRRERTPLPRVQCPQGLAGCREVSGRVVYVERVDPDGDGDLHVVLLGGASITGPGVTAVDVQPSLRPQRDPSVGDRVSAAGTVQTGSHGQAQIHAERFAVAGG